MLVIKTKDTRETLEAIGRIYGVDSNFSKQMNTQFFIDQQK